MNKKVLVFVTIFALLLGIGVGYALVTQDLNIGGGIISANNNELVKNLKAQFENTKFTEVSKLENGTVSDAVHSETGSVLSCSFAVSMMTKGSYAEYTNNIINNSDQYAAKLTYKVETSTGETVKELSNGVYQIGDYYKITITLSKTELTDISDSDSDLSKVTIRIEMIKTPIVDISKVSFVVTFNAEAVEL
jgi:N-acetyl-beta-hexosaminidase